MVLDATIATRGENKVWVVTFAGGGNSRAVGSGCDDDVAQALAIGGGFGAGLFFGNIGAIEIPFDGGTVNLSGSQGTGRASGTAIGTVTKKG